MKSKFFSAAICLAVGAQSAVSCAAHLSETLDETKLANNRETGAKKESFDEGLPSKKDIEATPEDLYDEEEPKDSATKDVVELGSSGINSLIGKNEKKVSKNRFNRSRKSFSILNNKKFKKVKNMISSFLGWGACLFISNKLAEKYLGFSSKSEKFPANPSFIPINVDKKVMSIMTSGEVNFNFLKLEAKHEKYVTAHIALFLNSLAKEFRKEGVDAFNFKSNIKYEGTKEEKESLVKALSLLPFKELKNSGLFGDRDESILRNVFDTLVSSEINFIESPDKEEANWNAGNQLAETGYDIWEGAKDLGKGFLKWSIGLNLPKNAKPKPGSTKSGTSLDDFKDMLWRAKGNINIVESLMRAYNPISDALTKLNHPVLGIVTAFFGAVYNNVNNNQQKR